MAQNVTIAGASYAGVPSVEIPKTGGGTALFVDTSGDTVAADKLLYGYTAHNAAGELITGIYSPVMPFAFILATYPAGSTCTCPTAIGSKNLSATQKLFYVSSAGDYVITATDGTNTATNTVTIGSEGISIATEIKYGLYLIRDGVKSVTWTCEGYHYDSNQGTYNQYEPTDDAGTGCRVVSLRGRSSSHPGGVYYCDFPNGYTTLHATFDATVYRNFDVGILDYKKTNYISTSMVRATKFTDNVSLQTIDIDISGISASNPKVCFGLCSSSATAYATSANIYDVWLE